MDIIINVTSNSGQEKQAYNHEVCGLALLFHTQGIHAVKASIKMWFCHAKSGPLLGPPKLDAQSGQ